MKVKVDCSNHKTEKDGKCYCSFLNRKWPREMKMYKQLMKSLEKKK